MPFHAFVGLALPLALVASGGCQRAPPGNPSTVVFATAGTAPLVLPPPGATPSVQKFSKVVGWPAGKTPRAKGFQVKAFARDLVNPRNLYIAPNGDVLVAEANTEMDGPKAFGAKLIGYAASERIAKSPNKITLLRDADHDGVPETRTVFLAGLNRPFGMAIVGDAFFVANTDGLYRYPYRRGQTAIEGPGTKILALPAGGYNNHWTRNLLVSEDGAKLFVTVGSGSNVAEHGVANEVRRANVLEVSLDGSGERVYASGLRNPVGLAYAPGTRTVWTAVNERDELGDELVPDYMTGLKPGAFYGWPYFYFGKHPDPRMKDVPVPPTAENPLVPDVPLGAHTASLGLAFDEGPMLGERYRGGAFVGQHGSWNRSTLSGYQVVFVPFSQGRPSGPPEEFLGGFIANAETREVYGRPVGVAFEKDGSLLVADDAGNTVWRVSLTATTPSSPSRTR